MKSNELSYTPKFAGSKNWNSKIGEIPYFSNIKKSNNKMASDNSKEITNSQKRFKKISSNSFYILKTIDKNKNHNLGYIEKIKKQQITLSKSVHKLKRNSSSKKLKLIEGKTIFRNNFQSSISNHSHASFKKNKKIKNSSFYQFDNQTKLNKIKIQNKKIHNTTSFTISTSNESLKYFNEDTQNHKELLNMDRHPESIIEECTESRGEIKKDMFYNPKNLSSHSSNQNEFTNDKKVNLSLLKKKIDTLRSKDNTCKKSENIKVLEQYSIDNIIIENESKDTEKNKEESQEALLLELKFK